MDLRLRALPCQCRSLSIHVRPADSYKQLRNSELSWQNGFLFFLYIKIIVVANKMRTCYHPRNGRGPKKSAGNRRGDYRREAFGHS